MHDDINIIELGANWDSSSFKEIYYSHIYKDFIQHVFDVKPLYYAVIDNNNNIQALAPFFLVTHLLTGSRLISTPYLEYGELYGDPLLIKLLIDFLMDKYNVVDDIEIRDKYGKYDSILTELSFERNFYYRYELLLSSKEKVFNKFSRQRKKGIRRSEKLGVIVRDIEKKDIERLYDLYLKNMKDFGSPPYPINYFISFISDIIPCGYGKIIGAFMDDKLISFLLGFTHNESIHITISVYDKEYQSTRPNDAVHWRFISWGIENGYSIFDFGRVRPDSGQYMYKKQWGGRMLKSNIWNYSQKANSLSLDENKIIYRIAIAVWKKMPLWLIKIIGPWVRKSLSI